MIRLLALLLIVAPVSAVITVAQGDIIYMNETVDITLAVAYPSYQIAWCTANNFDCDPPDQIIDTEAGNLEKYYIDPEIFRYGTYYRWDGKWHSAENAVAFTIIPGKRSKPSLTKSNITAPAQIRQEPEGPFNYLVARGDTAILTTRIYEPDNCHLWLFTNTNSTYDIDMVYGNGTYTTVLNGVVTYSLDNGEYPGYIQCNGKNSWQDVFYVDDMFDTPYDDSIVPDVPVMTWNLLNARRQFDDLVSVIPKFDDKLVPVILEVVDPETTVTDVQQDEDTLFISGVTTWSDGTTIILQLDPDQYPNERDRGFHTWQTFTKGSIDTPRTFSTALPFDKKELFIGTHEIVMKTEKNADTAVSSYTFKVSDVFVMPTPTPEIKRMIYGKDFEGIPVKIEPAPVNITNESWPEESAIASPKETVMVNVTRNITVKPTTTTPTTPMPTANETIPTIPINALITILAVGIGIAIREKI